MSSRVRRLIALVTLILALALVAVLTLRALGLPIAVGPLASPTDTPLPSVSATPAASAGPGDILAAIEAQVVDLRDLPPADIGPAEVVSRDELERRLAEQFAEDYPPDEVAADNAVLRALGLLTADQDIAGLQLQLLASSVLGYYDDTARQMVIVSDAGLTPEAQVTYAHEYTHALQDAAFGLDTMRIDATGEDDAVFARVGLVEGDATTAMVLWAVENLEPEDLLEISETPLPDTSGIPDWMLSQLEFPYLAGSEFTAQLYATGGFAAVDEAWLNPPASTEQVLHFPAYLDDEPPLGIDPLNPDIGFGGITVVDTTFGEAMIGIWLAHLGVSEARAATAAAGWGGDRLYGLVSPDGADVAVLLRIAWDSPVDADQFVDAYTDVLAQLPLFGHLERLSETEVVITQATSEGFAESFSGPLD